MWQSILTQLPPHEMLTAIWNVLAPSRTRQMQAGIFLARIVRGFGRHRLGVAFVALSIRLAGLRACSAIIARSAPLPFVLIPAVLGGAAAQPPPHHGDKPEPSQAQPANAFTPVPWASLESGFSTPAQKLDLTAEIAGADNLTVYGKRRHHEDRKPVPERLTLGPATLTGTTRSDRPGFSGLTVTAAVPVLGIAGLDATLDVSGGHDALNASTSSASAAAVAGLKLKF